MCRCVSTSEYGWLYLVCSYVWSCGWLCIRYVGASYIYINSCSLCSTTSDDVYTSTFTTYNHVRIIQRIVHDLNTMYRLSIYDTSLPPSVLPSLRSSLRVLEEGQDGCRHGVSSRCVGRRMRVEGSIWSRKRVAVHVRSDSTR